MDHDLVVRAQRGDREAFASLAVAAGDLLHAVAYRILRESDLAEDATKEALLGIWRDLRQLRDPARFDAWSYRLLVRACDTESRRPRRRSPNLHVLPVTDDTETNDGQGPVVDRDELERGFRRLTFDLRVVIVLHHYVDLPVEGIAGALGVPVGTVRSRLRYAMGGLRASLEGPANAVESGPPVMTAPEFRHAVRSWLELGPEQLPDRALDAVLEEVPDLRQRRRWLPRW